MATKPDVGLVAATKRFGETVAVDQLSLRIPAGSYCCLPAPSWVRRRQRHGSDAGKAA